MIGQTISRYKIVQKLGEGGMGEVWKAEDTTLGRPVALKFLAAHLLDDAEAKQRFLREARTAAAVRHPNICTVFEVGEEEGKAYLAMDYLDGESLEERIAQGPLPLQDALEIGRQVAEGLAAAHEKGVVHRDIKPANVMVDSQHRATILDFGLARLAEASKLTRQDQTVGTAAYMSPEQIQGGETDGRTDIWALGCVLYEMVAGVRPFQGRYDQALAYEIVNEEPEPLTAVRSGVPMELELFVGKCLSKDARDRYGSASELANDLRTLGAKLRSGRSAVLRTNASAVAGAHTELASYRVIEDLGESDDSRILRAQDVVRSRTVSIRIAPEEIAQRSDRRRVMLARAVAALTALLLLAVIAAVWLAAIRGGSRTAQRLRRFSIPLEDRPSEVAIAPDGAAIAYIMPPNELWVRDLDQEEPRLLGSFERPWILTPLAWSPDSRQIAYVSGSTIMAIRADGGPAVSLHTAGSSRSMIAALHWSPSADRLYFGIQAGGEGNGIYSVSALGGEPERIFQRRHSHDLLSPDGKHFLMQTSTETDSATAGHQIVIRGVGQAERTLEAPPAVATSLAYDPSGFLLFVVIQDEAPMIWALPFSMERLESRGEAFPVISGVDPSLSADGTLVYQSAGGLGDRQLRWFDRDGRALETIGLPQSRISYPNLSPDGRKVVVIAEVADSRDVWVHDVDRPVASRVTADERNKSFATWEPSGRFVSFAFMSQGRGLDLAMKRADGGGEEVLLSSEPESENGHYWSPDGSYLVYLFSPEFEVFYRKRLPNGEMGEQTPFLTTKFAERNGPFSPDGRWILYSSDETGRFEVYACRFPEGDRRTQISVGGGTQPRWRGDGQEVFFVREDTLMAASVSLGETVQVGQQSELFQHQGLIHAGTVAQYDVAADGQRFVVRDSTTTNEEPPAIKIVENWYEEFRDR